MSVLSKELVFLIIQFLNEEGYKVTARMLEQESGFYFYMDHFEDMVLDGQWEAAERYLSGFTKYNDNRYSTKIFFEMRKQNFLEALDENNRPKALDILMKDLKVFEVYDEDLFKEMTQLLTIRNIRDYKSLSAYEDTVSARANTMAELKKVIQANPIFQGKLRFPEMKHQRLRRLINQGLNWQHSQCLNPQPNPEIKTLFEDHVCDLPEDSISQPAYDTLKDENVEPLVQPSSPSTLTHSVAPSVVVSVLSSEEGVDADNQGGVEDDDAITSSGPAIKVDKVHGQELPLHEPTDLPKIVIRTFDVNSFPTSIDFHPTMQSVLLVGTRIGDISLWEVHSGDKIFSRNFKVWDIRMCSMEFKTVLVKDPQVSVNRITWSPDGSLFGAAFSKHLIQLYSHSNDAEIKQHLEIDAHAGAVTDLAFSAHEQQVLVITGGEDKIIKVWDAISGAKMFSLESHNAPIYSLCPHSKNGVNFIFSTSVDGKIKAWLYDDGGARVDYHAPGLGPTTMAYSGNNNRLFSCGTNPEGESFLVEWDESEGSIRRVYKGLAENLLDVVQFATSNNKYLAAGDDYMIKFWDMDHEELLMTTDADGDLPARPQIRFNKDGTLLAVIAAGYMIKVLGLGSGDGPNMPQPRQEVCSNSSYEVISEALKKLAINGSLTSSNPECVEAVKESPEEDCDSGKKKELKPEYIAYNRPEDSKIFYACDPSHCLSLRPSSDLKTGKISKLIYTNAGNAILALASDAVHLLWKWHQSGLNSSRTATAKFSPQFWQPKRGKLMMNQLSETPLHKVIPCFALSRNDSYLLSASGGIITLFNMLTFKTMTTLMPAPPAATCLAFYPRDNNILAIGMDDSTIVIYHARSNEIIANLEGHKERVTSLTFSDTLNVLVSSGGDAQIILWEVEGWKKRRAESLQHPNPNLPPGWFDTSVQFHRDQRRFLSANSTSLTIYDAKDLRRETMWYAATAFPGPVFGWIGGNARPITNAVFSCDGQMIYAGFCDGSVGVFDTLALGLCYRISRTAYLPQSISHDVFLTVVAAHPQIPTQFAVGLSDGGVCIVEPPPESKARWGPLPLDKEEEEEDEEDEEEGFIKACGQGNAEGIHVPADR